MADIPQRHIDEPFFEAFLHCKYKSRLQLEQTRGEPSGVEVHRRELDAAYVASARSTLLAGWPGGDLVRHAGVDRQALSRGDPLLVDVTLAVNGRSANPDAIERVEAPSLLGVFSYQPIQFVRGENLTRVDKLLLAYRSIVLGELQGALPYHGVVIHGSNFRRVRLPLPALQAKARRVLQELEKQAASPANTPLVLNQHCPVCEFRAHCRGEAIKTDNLSLLAGMTAREIRAQNQKGIFTVNQLSYTFRHRKPSKRAKHPANPHHFALQALSLRTSTVHIHGSPFLPLGQALVFFDLEGLPKDGSYYLIGALVVQNDNDKAEYHPFWADSTADQALICSQFVSFVASLPDCKLFHFGRYDSAALQQLRDVLDPQLASQLDGLLGASVDVHALVHAHIYFPTYSTSLKDIASFLGYQWAESGATGLDTIVWREGWELTHDFALKEKLIRYNRDDCLALKLVCDFIRSVTADRDPSQPGARDGPKVALTKDLIRRTRTWVKYGRPTFALKDLERASNSAHFDYQRERVFARTDKKVARLHQLQRRQRTSLKPNKVVEITTPVCTRCGSRNVKPIAPVYRRVIDLRFLRSGVKKCVIKYASKRYTCADCQRSCLPEAWPKYRGIYGDQLAIWCVYQNIRGRQTMCQVVEALQELFSIRIGPEQAHRFKRRIVSRYDALHRELRDHVLRSSVLHVDEADVAIRKTKGYVWVFSSLDAVWYLYKPTRAGDFLKELLSGFSGVLVSDFYSAYDSIDCPQQKCLLHLLRDVNDDLQKNPFDEEFKSIAQQFGVVLRAIVETLDKYGMKKRHLHKHKPAADSFVQYVSSHPFTSEVALSYQKRFKKAGPKLFTFLDYDNVPWNNTCAEHAVKNFMKYKRTSDGLFSERSLEEALVMLSIVQTCKLNGVNVLKFLLSKRDDLPTILGVHPLVSGQLPVRQAHGETGKT
jgi:predicted RecB family nuclease